MLHAGDGLLWILKLEMLTDERLLRIILDGLEVRQMRLTQGLLLRGFPVKLLAGIADLEPWLPLAMTSMQSARPVRRVAG